MYIPEHFAETRVDVLHDLVHRHPLGTLVALTPEGLDANHLPFDLDPAPLPFGILRGHVARANSFWRKVSPDSEVLAIFQGPDAYIRPGWYPTKRETEWKTSQNRGPADRDGVIAGLLQEGCESATAIARLVPRGKGK